MTTQLYPSTELVYINDSTIHNLSTVVSAIITEENDTISIITQITPFYVRGGGQKSDIGFIRTVDANFQVTEVRNDEGIIKHYGYFEYGIFSIGEKVIMQIDSFTRNINTQLHTAGELICAAVRKLGYDWQVAGAIHYPDRCSIDFKTTLTTEQISSIQTQLYDELKFMILNGSEIDITTYRNNRKAVISSCGYFPEYISNDEPIRVVTVWKGIYGRPCMGTHLTNINQLLSIQIVGIKSKKCITTIKYQLQDVGKY